MREGSIHHSAAAWNWNWNWNWNVVLGESEGREGGMYEVAASGECDSGRR